MELDLLSSGGWRILLEIPLETADTPVAREARNPWQHRFALLLAVWALFVVITGTAFTTNEERPFHDFGQWHAMAGTLAGILTLGLAVWLLRTRKGTLAAQFAWLTVAVVVVESLLGLPEVPPPVPVRVLHALLAQLCFSAFAAMAVFTSPGWEQGTGPFKAGIVRTLARFAPVAMLAQATLGIAFRHGVSEVMPHIFGGLTVGVFILVPCMFVIYRPEYEAARTAGVTALVITGVQIVLGFALFTMGTIGDIDPVVVIVTTMIHAAVAALTLAATVILAAPAWRGR